MTKICKNAFDFSIGSNANYMSQEIFLILIYTFVDI